jgi:hypothetical protein
VGLLPVGQTVQHRAGFPQGFNISSEQGSRVADAVVEAEEGEEGLGRGFAAKG